MADTPTLQTSDRRELAEDIRILFEELDSMLSPELRAHSGECHPALDVRETGAAVEIVVDVAGIPPAAIRVLFRDGVVVVAGEKAPSPITTSHTFHLVERDFGRFARAVRLTGAFDLDAARARVVDGELTISLPKRRERRGSSHRIAIDEPRS